MNQPHRAGTPGKLDVNGVEWWACDPYPCWYRWENGELFTNPEWPDEDDDVPDSYQVPF